MADHAINFAISAWHLIDWTWKGRQTERLIFRGEAADNAPNRSCTLGAFRTFIIEREPRLRYSGLIANSAKHLVLEDERWREEGTTETYFSAIETGIKGEGQVTSDIFKRSGGWVPKIIVDDQRLDAMTEFAAILDFWSGFVHGETIEDTLEIVEGSQK